MPGPHFSQIIPCPCGTAILGCVPKSARAFFSSLLKVEEVQDILGHEDIRNTMIYAKITNTRRRTRTAGPGRWRELLGDWS